MDKVDAYFTHTIVGAPVSVRLGERVQVPEPKVPGLKASLRSGRFRLVDAWHDWVVLRHELDRVGRPRMRPGPIRRLLERHALWIGVLGLLSIAAAVLHVIWLHGGLS